MAIYAGVFGVAIVDLGALVEVLAYFIITWITMVIAAIFLRRSFNAIADKLKAGLFKTTALVYLIGAILLIVLIGGIIMFIALILMIIAFFTMPTKLPPAGSPTA